MGDVQNQGDLESRLSASSRIADSVHKGIDAAFEGVKNGSRNVLLPYLSLVRHPEKPFYALGDIVKNVVQIPTAFYSYWKYGASAPFVFDRKLSHSLALAEAIAFYGAKKGANFISGFSDSNFIQAGVGGFIGSEVTTAAVFFLTYMAFSSVINLRTKDGKSATCKLASSLKETCKVSLITIPAGVASFASADTGVASLAVFVGASPETAATIGCVAGSVLYSGTAKVAVKTCSENGYLNKK